MKILELLKLDASSIKDRKAERKAESLRTGQMILKNKLEGEKDILLEKEDALLTCTTDTVKTENWNEEFQKVQLDLAMKNREIKACDDTTLKYFTREAKPEV